MLAAKNSALVSRIKVYEACFQKTSFTKFLAILEGLNKKVIDSSVAPVLENYFELLLLKIKPDLIPLVLADLQKSKHFNYLQPIFIKAVIKTNLGILGVSFVKNFDNIPNRTLIQSFLTSLPEKHRNKEYQVALDILKNDHSENLIYYSDDYRRHVKNTIKELSNMELV